MTDETMTLPALALDDIPESTKDFLLSICGRDGVSPALAVKGVLDRAAERAGFRLRRPGAVEVPLAVAVSSVG